VSECRRLERNPKDSTQKTAIIFCNKRTTSVHVTIFLSSRRSTVLKPSRFVHSLFPLLYLPSNIIFIGFKIELIAVKWFKGQNEVRMQRWPWKENEWRMAFQVETFPYLRRLRFASLETSLNRRQSFRFVLNLYISRKSESGRV
jgi:hypothetical protein